MRLECVPCRGEIHEGSGLGGDIIHGSTGAACEQLLERYAGQVQTLYMDPPFNSNRQYVLKMGVGEAGWRTGSPSITLPAYNDQWPDASEYLAMMRGAFEPAHALLRPEGALFVHIDVRMHAKFRIMLEEIFGEENFVNEIVWAYQTGGRSKHYFSRKHDTILFFRKSPALFFDITAVPVSRKERKNHMKRSVDPDGRAYRSIWSAGKEYRYYDDAPAYPSDVWDDVSHLQQKDPQRSGFDSQKPLPLLSRVIGCSSQAGDLVADLFAGSGTTLVAASDMGRRFLGLDASSAAIASIRRRLVDRQWSLHSQTAEGVPLIDADWIAAVGFYQVELKSYVIEASLCPHAPEGLAHVDQWSVGYLRDGYFYSYAHAARSKAHPSLEGCLSLPVLNDEAAILTVDVLGRRLVHRIVN